MTVLRRLVMLAALLIAAVAVPGCGSGPGPVPGVTGSFGTDPVITIPNGTPSAQMIVKTVIPGRGPVIGPGDYVLFNVEGKVWAGDREVVDSYTDRQPQGLPLRSPSALPAWRRLAGQRVGSRVLMVVPPRDGFGRRGDPQANIMSTDTLVFVFDLLGAMREKAHARGTVVPYHPGPDLPRVGWGSRGAVITPPATARPPRRWSGGSWCAGTGGRSATARPSWSSTPAWCGAPARPSIPAGPGGSPNRSCSARGR